MQNYIIELSSSRRSKSQPFKGDKLFQAISLLCFCEIVHLCCTVCWTNHGSSTWHQLRWRQSEKANAELLHCTPPVGHANQWRPFFSEASASQHPSDFSVGAAFQAFPNVCWAALATERPSPWPRKRCFRVRENRNPFFLRIRSVTGVTVPEVFDQVDATQTSHLS